MASVLTFTIHSSLLCHAGSANVVSMRITISKDAAGLGHQAALEAACTINDAIARNGEARIVLSTGSSQFETLAELVHMDVDWSRVTMFHLDEYLGLDAGHPASFRKYLLERFISLVPLKAYHLVEGKEAQLPELGRLLNEKPIDLGIIGIGENGHIAFNDPPADIATDEPYIIVTLNDACKRQQVGEGWFPTVDDVPAKAVSMSCRQILKCHHIVSAVPHRVKAKAIHDTLTAKAVTADIPATMLRTHPHWSLFLDTDSASMLTLDEIAKVERL